MLRVLIALVGLLPSLLMADVVSVRSGEHQDFTRLVFKMPSSDIKWEFKSDRPDPRLEVDAKNLQFDLTKVFDRIPRTRLGGIRQNGSSVSLALNCQCAIRAFQFMDHSVVIDILDPRPENETMDPEKQEPESSHLQTTMRIDASEFETFRSNAIGIEQHIEAQPQNDAFATELEERLEKATAQSVVLAVTSGDIEDRPLDTQHKQDHLPVQHNQGTPQNFALHTSNGLDELIKDDLASLVNRESHHCAPIHAVSFDHLDLTTPPLEQLGALRRDLVGEFDRTNPTVSIKMAILLTYLTFGAEAREVLQLVSEREETWALTALSHLVEGNLEPAQTYFARQSTCSDWHSFWSTISGANPDLSDEQAHLALRMIGQFPDHLRRELGPVLAQRMMDADRLDEAEQALVFVDRVVEGLDARSTLVRAQLESDNGDYPAADILLERVVSEGTEVSPPALIEQVLLFKSQGLPPPEDLVSLVAAYAVEHRRTSHGPELRRASAVARALAGQFDLAFSSLEEISKRDGAERAVEVKSELAAILVVGAEEFDLVRAAILFDLSTDLRSDLALTMANRLLDAGFLELAEQSFGNIPPSITREHRLFRARLALRKGLPHRAQAELLGLEGDNVERLRGEALANSERLQEAAKTYRDVGMPEEANRMAWLAGDWETLTISPNRLHSQLANWKMANEVGTNNSATSGEAVLARHQALIESSLTFRELTGSLLAQHQIGDLSMP